MAKPKKEKTSLKDQFDALGNLRPFFRMIWQTSPRLTVANILLRLLKSVLPVIMLWVGKIIIDEIVRLIDTPNGDQTLLWTMVGVELGLAMLSELLNRGIGLMDSLLGDLFANETSVRLIRHAATLDLYQFENAEFYDKLERARRQTIGRTVLMSQVLSQAQDIITVVSLGAGLIAFSPWLLLLLFVAIIPSFLGETHFNHRTYSLTRNWTPERRELDYLRYIGASDVTAKEVKIFDLSEFLAGRFQELADRYYHANRKIATSRALWGSLLSSIGTLAYYGAYVFIILQTVAGVLTLGTLTFLAGSFRQMRGMLQGIMNRFTQIADNALYLQDLFDFLAIQPNIKADKNKLPVPEVLTDGFRFEDVSFKYPGTEVYALRDLTVHLRAGEKMALVGENGAGKTTFVKLLARLYEPTSGRILLEGRPLDDYDLASLRAAIGVIFQDFVRFSLKARENIAVGDIDAREELPRVQTAAEKSLADEVVRELADGYEQVLGKRFQGGVDLSGGQWQKIALGRAYMREARLYILDEPTAALDARAEYEVFQRFANLIEGKTAVLISHRFSTVRMADRILFLEQGRKLELGSHEELVALGGKYAELFELQAAGYQ